MASREMIDVLDRLRDLDKVKPNVHSDALENTEKLNPPVEEAKKKMVKDPKTGKMVPSYAIDGKGKDDLKKENVKEAEEEKQYAVYVAGAKVHKGWVSHDDAEKIVQKYKDSGKFKDNAFEIRPENSGERQRVKESKTAPKEVKKLMAGHTYTCEDCGCEMHKCDKDCDCKNDSHDELGSYWKDENGNGIPDVAESVNESITISADSESDLPMIAQIMKLAGMKTVTPDMMPDADNVPMMKSDDDINANNDDDCGCEDDDNAVVTKTDTGIDFDLDQDGEPDMSYSEQERLAHLAGIENEDEDTEEGFANSMGDEKEEPTYKGYDPDYAKDAGAATRKTKQVPANSGDNPLEAIENNLRSAYDTFKEELWNELSDGKEHTSEGRGKVMAGRGRGKVMAGRGRGKDKLMAGRGRGKSEDVKTSEGRGRGKGKKK